MSDLKVDGITAATADTAVTIKGLGTGKVVLGDGELIFPDADGAAGTAIVTNGSGTLSFAATGKVVARYYAEYKTFGSTTTVLPGDDTIPVITEGTQILTLTTDALASSSNRIRISYGGVVSHASASSYAALALFNGATNAIHVTGNIQGGSAGHVGGVCNGVYEYAPGATTALVISLRFGGQAGTVKINGKGNGRQYGGVQSTFLVVEELNP